MATKTVSSSFNFDGMSAMHPSAIGSNCLGKAKFLAEQIADYAAGVAFDHTRGAEYGCTVTIEFFGPEAGSRPVVVAESAAPLAEPDPASQPDTTPVVVPDGWESLEFPVLKSLAQDLGLNPPGVVSKKSLLEMIGSHVGSV